MNNEPGTAHLLLIDDDALLRGMVTKTLQHAGFEVSAAASGEAALAQFAERQYDLVLLDVMMPGLDGYETCRRIRSMPGGALVPILIFTGLNDTLSIDHAYRNGATDFITKPINWSLLSHRVRYALRASFAAEAMLRSRESLARAQRLAGIGNWAVFSDGRIECSAELFRIYGVPTDFDWGTFAKTAAARVVATDRERVTAARSRMETHGEPYQLEFRITRGDGAVRMVFEQAALVTSAHARLNSYEGITQDITERVQATERIRQLAHYDEFTGLPNRHFFAELAEPSLERARRNGTGCAILHVDIDRFTAVNDAFGRVHGDAVLKVTAERLRSWIRSGDLASMARAHDERCVLARIGGNAFTLLIADLPDQQQAASVARRLLGAIEQPIALESQSLVLTASIGIALFPGDGADMAALAHRSEQALHAAKATGRGQYRFFDEEINARAARRLSLESDLRRGIAQDELRLHFQPKVDVSTGAIIGAEALVRWQHPERGLVPPAEFIAVAEETGLIAPLTDWVLESACRTLREWLDAGLPGVPLSVNIAASSLADTTLVSRLDALMQRFGLQAPSLMLEMTETMLMGDAESGIALLETLRTRGYGLSLDDFGTGYSSLSYLKRFSIDELKIDRSFVTDAPRGGRDGAVAAAIIALGRELGLRVLAEGVETPEQSAFLLRRGCNVQQGYLFSRPVPARALEQLFRDGPIKPRRCGPQQLAVR
jgi:diguanylate cyclase (GGDEF)-like protein